MRGKTIEKNKGRQSSPFNKFDFKKYDLDEKYIDDEVFNQRRYCHGIYTKIPTATLRLTAKGKKKLFATHSHYPKNQKTTRGI